MLPGDLEVQLEHPIVVGYPLQLVAMDILGPLPQTSDNAYILVAEDYFTRWLEAWPIPNQETGTVARLSCIVIV